MTTERVVLTPKESHFRLPSEPTLMEVTADMASDWLSYRNHPTNRPLSKPVTARYQADMEAGRWLESSQGISFDTDGFLIDGQHRLKAMANAGVSLKIWVFPAELHETFSVFDGGFKRKAAHMLHVPNAHNTATTLRFLATLADRDRWTLARYSRVTTAEILATMREWPEATWYTDKLQHLWRATSMPIGPHGAVLAQAARTENRDQITPWLDGLLTGADLTRGDPRLALRNRFSSGYRAITERSKRDVEYSLLVKGWNAFVSGTPVNMVRVSVNEALPFVTGFDWDTRNVPADGE